MLRPLKRSDHHSNQLSEYTEFLKEFLKECCRTELNFKEDNTIKNEIFVASILNGFVLLQIHDS